MPLRHEARSKGNTGFRCGDYGVSSSTVSFSNDLRQRTLQRVAGAGCPSHGCKLFIDCRAMTNCLRHLVEIASAAARQRMEHPLTQVGCLEHKALWEEKHADRWSTEGRRKLGQF